MSRPTHAAADHPGGPILLRSFAPLALITVGVVLLLANVVPEPARPGLILLGLGTAFGIGRLATGRYGYAVPGGILLALGVYIILERWQPAGAFHSGGWFFIMLGLGFLAMYFIGLRPGTVWPLFPGVLLIALGLVQLGVTRLAPLASLAWIAMYWPLALVLLGLWLVFRDHVPGGLRPLLASLGGLALLGYGVLAAAATVAAGGGTLASSGFAPRPGFGPAPFADTLVQSAPLASGQTLTIANPSGQTVVRAAAVETVRVSAVRHFSSGAGAPQVQLVPSGGGLKLTASGGGGGPWPFGGDATVDYTVEVPTAANVDISSSSGAIEVDDVAGSVHAQSASGAITLNNVAGPVVATSKSGRIQGTGLAQVQQVSTASGAVALDGVFAEAGQISTASGSVAVRLLPGSAVALDVHTASGRISAAGLSLSNTAQQANSLSATLGAPAAGATLTIRTASGRVTLSQ